MQEPVFAKSVARRADSDIRSRRMQVESQDLVVELLSNSELPECQRPPNGLFTRCALHLETPTSGPPCNVAGSGISDMIAGCSDKEHVELDRQVIPSCQQSASGKVFDMSLALEGMQGLDRIRAWRRDVSSGEN